MNTSLPLSSHHLHYPRAVLDVELGKHMPIRRAYVPSLPTATKRKKNKNKKSEELLEKPVASCFVSFPLASIAKTELRKGRIDRRRGV
jgi:hypothetical protein